MNFAESKFERLNRPKIVTIREMVLDNLRVKVREIVLVVII